MAERTKVESVEFEPTLHDERLDVHEGSEMSERVELRTIVQATLRRWWLVLPLIALAGGLAYAISLQIPPVYRAETSVLVGGTLSDPRQTPEDVEVTEHATIVYADMVGRQLVLQDVVSSLGLPITWEELGNQVHGELVTSNTDLIVISADANSIEEATEIAQATATALVRLSSGGQANQLEVIEEAHGSSTPVVPNVEFNVLIAASLGLLLGTAIAYVLEFRRRERARVALGLSHLPTSREERRLPRSEPGASEPPTANE